MSTTILHKTAELGQSLWLDTISRELLVSKGLDDWIEKGVLGVTTNPAIFEQAIAKMTSYDRKIQELAQQEKSSSEICETLMLQEVGAAADVFRSVYERTGGVDGYVSLEVSPLLAADAASTITEAVRLFSALARPNVLIKIPATLEGIEAIETCIARGINVNATLIFSVEQYAKTAWAYIRGLEKRATQDLSLTIASVASVFVSRIDGAVDPLLSDKGVSELRGRLAVDNARLTYEKFKEIFSSKNAHWCALFEKGARVQRPLWASTGTKDPSYSDVLYVENLIGPDTVNTLPLKTLNAFLDHGRVESTLELDMEDVYARFVRLKEAEIDIEDVCESLLKKGLESFNVAWTELIESIEEKSKVR